MAKGSEHCLMETISKAMDNDPGLRAVRMDRSHHKVSVASVGRSTRPDVEAEITGQLRAIEEEPEDIRCGLIDGTRECETCPSRPKEGSAGMVIERTEGATTISRPTCPTAPSFWRWHDIPWPKLVPRQVLPPDEADYENEWKPQLLAAALCGGFALTGALVGTTAGVPWLYIAAYLAGAWHAVHEVRERLQQRVLDVHFLMLAVAAGSAAIGAWGEGAVLLFLFSFSGALEHYALGRTQREIRSLFKTAPKTATVMGVDGQERTVAVEELTEGARLRVKPGDQFPVDAEVVKGRTAADESTLTGEAAPVDKSVGDTLYAGTMNLWGAVDARVLRPASESALQKIILLIREAQRHKAPSQRFTDRFGTGYTYGILALSAAMFLVWWLGFGLPAFHGNEAAPSAFYRSMTLLVVASPCALVLSIPSAILAALAWAAKRGVLFRGGAAVEKLAEVTLVALDKTGTLTTGELHVQRVESFPPACEREVAERAFALERLSTHPLARAITRHGKQGKLPERDVEHLESVTGRGLRATVDGQQIVLGSRGWLMESLGDSPAAKWLAELPTPTVGSSEVCVAWGDNAGRLVLQDSVRPQARELIARLKEDQIGAVLLTGDHKEAALALKDQLGLGEIRAELKPEDKVAAIQDFTKQGNRVAMIGDGVNDAPSLAAAHVAVAMGARGSDAALEQADIVLMHDRLENFLLAAELSRRARRIIRQNLMISLATVVVLVVAALGGAIPLTLGVIGHEGSTVIVVMNSLRLLMRGGPKSGEPVTVAPAVAPA